MLCLCRGLGRGGSLGSLLCVQLSLLCMLLRQLSLQEKPSCLCDQHISL